MGTLNILSSATPFSLVDWSAVESIEHPGETGLALWRTVNVDNVRLRRVHYSPGYLADHWCTRGHVIFVLSGTLVTELDDGRSIATRAGSSYHVGDDASSHRSSTATGVELFIVD